MLAGGGTAGHINPAIAIAKGIRAKMAESEILFVGTQAGLEQDLVKRAGFPLESIRVKGFRRKLSLDTLATVKELFVGLAQAKALLKTYQPDVVIGTGGYVCGPVLYKAAKMNIPTLIHEQNALPGVTNRLLGKFVDVVAVSFEESISQFKRSKKVILTGNPIRNELLMGDRTKARKNMGVGATEKLVVVFGGSRGARNINLAMVEMLNKYFDGSFRILFATGKVGHDEMFRQLGERTIQNAQVVPYIYNMEEALYAADLVVCRSGAITLAELCCVGVPSILIPSPFVTANHQEVNARVLEKEKACEVLLEKELSAKELFHQIEKLLKNEQQLTEMGMRAKKLGRVDATNVIVSSIFDLKRQA